MHHNDDPAPLTGTHADQPTLATLSESQAYALLVQLCEASAELPLPAATAVMTAFDRVAEVVHPDQLLLDSGLTPAEALTKATQVLEVLVSEAELLSRALVFDGALFELRLAAAELTLHEDRR